ncbi:MAG: SLATT domain-containing protein [Cyanobacteria bacterium P01_E01_bin.42]
MAFDQNHFDKVLIEIQRHIEDTETSKLAHWHAADVYGRWHRWFIGLPATILATILTWLLSSDFQGLISNTSDSVVLRFLVAQLPVFIAFPVSLLSALGTFLNYNELAIKHRTAAENLHALWRNCKNWETDFPDQSMCEKAVQAVQQYRKRLNEINRDSPQIPKWAWKSVKKQQIEGSTTYTFENNTEHESNTDSIL